MTKGYESWWNVGCTQQPRNAEQKKALSERQAHLSAARRY